MAPRRRAAAYAIAAAALLGMLFAGSELKLSNTFLDAAGVFRGVTSQLSKPNFALGASKLPSRRGHSSTSSSGAQTWTAWTPAEQRRSLAYLPDGCSRVIDAVREYAEWREIAIERLLEEGEGEPTLEQMEEGLRIAMYADIGGGWGDRLPAMVSLFAFAMRYKRVFFIDWRPLSRWMTSPFFDWRFEASAMPELAYRVRSRINLNTLYTCEPWGGTRRGCLWDRPRPDQRFDRSVLHFASNRGIWTLSSLPEHVSFFKNLTGGSPACLHKALFQPTPELLARAAPMIQRIEALRASGLRVVGFHYRAGDHTLVGNGAQHKNVTVDDMLQGWRGTLLKCAADPKTVLFFLSDSATLRRNVQAQFGEERVLLSPLQPKHVGDKEVAATAVNESEALGDMLAEWLMLQATDFVVVGRGDSGFARSAVLHSRNASYGYEVYMYHTPMERCEPSFHGALDVIPPWSDEELAAGRVPPEIQQRPRFYINSGV